MFSTLSVTEIIICTTFELWSASALILVDSLPNGKILDWSKLKAFADNRISMKQKLKFDMEKVENIVGKVENAGYQSNQHFLLFPQCFQKASFSGSFKVGIVW